MLTLIGLMWLASYAVLPGNAWGGLFNRFSPEMLSNMGYGGHGSYRPQPYMQNNGAIDSFRDNQENEIEPCFGKLCTANEHCCPGYFCIHVEGDVGSCLFGYGLRQGEMCQRDNDCETGLICAETTEGRTCQPPMTSRKQYSEDCTMSSECDIRKGLCCQLQRRHRQAPRKICSYFKDPLVCIGPVASDFIKMPDIERTAGEKRLTSKSVSSGYTHLKR